MIIKNVIEKTKIGGGLEMTKNVMEKAMVSCHKFTSK